MPRLLKMVLSILLAVCLSRAARAQDSRLSLAYEELPCSFCHICENPTPRYVCLRRCPRTSAVAIEREMSAKPGPDLVILDALEDQYLPVPFDHRGHAEMTRMTEGCAVCHHYTSDAAVQPACRGCHERSPQADDMRKPSLKAAYHRQCMSCHREWSHTTACGVCHPPKVGPGGASPVTHQPTKDDIIGTMHPPIPEPHTEIYEPASKPSPGEKVIFRHQEHTRRFGLACVDCHREDSCVRCHEEGRSHQQRPRTLEEHHQPCAKCHDVDNNDTCNRCHWKEGKEKPKAFDHAATGWPLSDHHIVLGCRACHKRVPFRRLERDCNTCHYDWKPETFDHAVTRQVLDQNHAKIDCADCHENRKFSSPPTCEECHEEDEGITYPEKRPGPFAIPSRRVGDPSP
ncbi:MAG: hypothetical protein C4523_12855 [Myxococcales bacterium]|nr:MAG: hypothetical protein C4523_12855 [Myxococcales bacterium]